MSTYTMVRAMVHTDVADAARDKAETEGKTLAEIVDGLLASYVAAPGEKRAVKKRAAKKAVK